jgi:H+/Cl- antiporter ClcA
MPHIPSIAFIVIGIVGGLFTMTIVSLYKFIFEKLRN